MARRPTAQDVADLVGVSRSSVSLVLNGRGAGNISEAKQQAIIEAARQLDYRPNALALSLRNQRTWTIGLLTWGGHSAFTRGSASVPMGLMQGAWVASAAAGFSIISVDAGLTHEDLTRAIANLLDRQVDGFLVVSPELVEWPLPEELARVPVVLLNCVEPNRRATSIVPDELGAGACGAQILLDRGHQRIALLTDEGPTLQLQERLAGITGSFEQGGVADPLILTAETLSEGHAAVGEALAGSEPPTAILCTRERLALGALLAASQSGLRVPEDLSIIAMDDGQDLAASLVPKLATLQRPDLAMAEQAVAILLHALTREGEADIRQLTFACPAHLNDSIATGPGPTL